MTDSVSSYSIPLESQKLLKDGILKNPLQRDLPPEAASFSQYVKFVGSDAPSIPINWRFAESVASLKGFEAVMINVLLKHKYGLEPQYVVINTDHAQLFFMSAMLSQIDPPENSPVEPSPIRALTVRFAASFPNREIHEPGSSLYRLATTNIYKTRDNRCFHLHGSMNPDPSLSAMGLPHDIQELNTTELSWAPFIEKVSQWDAVDLEEHINEKYRQAGTICWTPEEYANSVHGKANAHVGLYEVHRRPSLRQVPSWWPDTRSTSPQRPLMGLKVVDLTRVIAGPAIGRGLAELGASVMRVTANHLPDFSGLHPDMNWGKWNTVLDLREAGNRTKLRDLILEADVVVDGYRPGVMKKWGFGQEDIIDLCKDRDRGIIYVRENCYGWSGPWAHRSGWQMISDANCGVSMEYGRAMGNNEAVTPVFPNSDYCTGIAGTCAVLQALIQRGETGGSYTLDVALNYYSQWLVNSCGVYPAGVWNDVWTRNGRRVFRHYHSMNVTVPAYLEMLQQNGRETVLNLAHFEMRESKAVGLCFRTVKPVIQFPTGSVRLGFNVGTRGNGVDKPYWPKDLMQEVVT